MIQCRLAAKAAVHAEVVTRVILVVGVGFENRAEIEDLDAEISEVVQLLGHSPEIAAKMNMVRQRRAGVRSELRHASLPVRVDLRSAIPRATVGLTLTAIKTIHENMIHDPLAKPGRRRVVRLMDQKAEGSAAVGHKLKINVIAGIRKESVRAADEE